MLFFLVLFLKGILGFDAYMFLNYTFESFFVQPFHDYNAWPGLASSRSYSHPYYAYYFYGVIHTNMALSLL